MQSSYDYRNKQGMDKVTDVIDALGGTSAVARALNIPASTVSSWKSAGRIPNWRVPTLVKLARAKGFSLNAKMICGVGA